MDEQTFQTYKEFGEACSRLYAYCPLSNREADHKAYYRAHNLAKDAYSLFPVLIEEIRKLKFKSSESLSSWMDKDLQNLKNGVESTHNLSLHDIEQDRVTALFKSIIFLIKALQDSIYNLILLAHNQEIAARGGEDTGMKKAVNQYFNNQRSNNPVTRILKSKCSGYPEWFSYFRDMRNLIKEGQTAACSINTGSDGSWNFALCIQLENTRLSSKRLDCTPNDILVAIKHTTELINAYIDEAILRSAIKLIEETRLAKYNEVQSRLRITTQFCGAEIGPQI